MLMMWLVTEAAVGDAVVVVVAVGPIWAIWMDLTTARLKKGIGNILMVNIKLMWHRCHISVNDYIIILYWHLILNYR